MGTTTNYAWPYPELSDPPNGAGQIEALASAIDTSVKVIDNAVDVRLDNVEAPLPLVCVEQSVVQSIPDGAATALSMDVEIFDPFGMHAPANPTRLVAPKAGYYRLSGAISYAGNTAGRRSTAWGVNGVTYGNSLLFAPTPISITAIPAPDCIVFLGVGGYVELRAYHSGTGGALSTYTAVSNRSYATMQYLSA